MQVRNKLLACCSAMSLMLSGCATGQLQVGRASEMVKAGRATTDASRSLVTDTIASHQRFVVEIAALDPTCGLPEPKILLGQNGWSSCVDGLADLGTTLRDPSRSYAKLSLATINGAVAYLDALDAVSTRNAGGGDEGRRRPADAGLPGAPVDSFETFFKFAGVL